METSFLYGTAWKEERTAALVTLALRAGFRGIDTANQRKHYHEAGVGEALASAFADGLVTRDELFLQTKFTFARGQDHRLPYDPAASFAQQVEQSFRSSLTHLGVEWLDSLVLHGPMENHGLVAADYEAWQAMEALQRAGGVRNVGVSNVEPAQLQALIEHATIAPRFVQNRCYARTGWDADVRAICTRANITYQGFSLLTANRNVVASPALAAIAKTHAATPAQIIFRFAMQVGMLPLTGTSDAKHMAEDLASQKLTLTAAEVATIGNLR